jgi:hypothetical protein
MEFPVEGRRGIGVSAESLQDITLIMQDVMACPAIAGVQPPVEKKEIESRANVHR